jgi:acetoin utilization protein AcuB
MLVVERMTPNPVVVTPETTVAAALRIVEDEHLRHLPVVDDQGSLVGIVSEKDLLRANAQLPVRQMMTPDVVTVTEYTPLEQAARVMSDHKISSLPVMRSGRLVGIITETDLFKIFLELLGARYEGVRLTMLVPEEPGILANLTAEIAGMGGNILAMGTFMGEDPTNRMITVKVEHVSEKKLVAVMEALGMEIIDVRQL